MEVSSLELFTQAWEVVEVFIRNHPLLTIALVAGIITGAAFVAIDTVASKK